MSGSGRDEAPFSGRVWQEIDRTVAAVRAANCTARRFLEVDGPYGMGLTSIAGNEGWLRPAELGASPGAWHVTHPHQRENCDLPDRVSGGTYLVQGDSRPVPLIASDFLLGMRAIEAYETGCQPLDLCRATDAARDVALEEERLLYYGTGDNSDYLLRIAERPNASGTLVPQNVTPVAPYPADPMRPLREAIAALAKRGYAGPFALAAEPDLYTQLYAPTAAANVLYVDLLRSLFRGGVYLAPVIDPAHDGTRHRRGAIITAGAAYSRLVVGQDWLTTYRGRDGVLHRFLIMDSLQLRICSDLSIQVLTMGRAEEEAAAPPQTQRARRAGQ
jgi:uncharacterized linocin/CFP29 family protein